MRIPAFAAIGFWVLLQFVSIAPIDPEAQTGGVTYMAHIGGFIAGLVLSYIFRGDGRQTAI